MSSWGQGLPDEEKIESEAGDLVHARYVLAAAKGTEPQSSATQFYITVGTAHHLDGIHTIFGTVVEGSEFVDQIAGVEIRPQETGNPADIPVDPIPQILSAKRAGE
jgi:peptidyl-prolyl cis-trans isomerase A (cyclophilin A)